jgi:signal transduction histidine kinase
MSDSRLAVEVGVEGEPRPLPPTVDVSAYRIVQEALTNALKHSGGTRADVRVRYRPGELEVEIVDNGRRGARAAATRNGGLGLIGMRERAALHGGQLSAGPGPAGGFAVRALLPTPEAAL